MSSLSAPLARRCGRGREAARPSSARPGSSPGAPTRSPELLRARLADRAHEARRARLGAQEVASRMSQRCAVRLQPIPARSAATIASVELPRSSGHGRGRAAAHGDVARARAPSGGRAGSSRRCAAASAACPRAASAGRGSRAAEAASDRRRDQRLAERAASKASASACTPIAARLHRHDPDLVAEPLERCDLREQKRLEGPCGRLEVT